MQDRTVERLGTVSAALAWLAIGFVQVVGTIGGEGASPPAWWIAYLAYGAAYLVVALAPEEDWPRTRELWIILALVVPLGVTVVLLSTSMGSTSIALVMNAVLLSQALAWPQALAAILVQTAAVMVGIAGRVSTENGIAYAAASSVAFLAFQVFVLLMVLALRAADTARAEADRARAQAEAATAALWQAQADLAATSRAAERLRIARDLHDVVGHQLTALSVNLQVAARMVSGPSHDRIEVCRAVASDLLRDVRDVVSQLRERRDGIEATDLEEELRRIGGTVPTPVVHVDVDPRLPSLSSREADVVRRCVQEVVTNAARHSAASSLWIAVEELDGVVSVTARDDGVGVTQDADGGSLVPGHGLTGMLERFAALGGSVAWSSRPGNGFSLQASLPLDTGPESVSSTGSRTESATGDVA